jgi:hypothetical protein
MSYDLMVFEPEAAPKNHDGFMEWYFGLTKWNDGPYDDPARTSARLRAWVKEMQRTFPDINSPQAEIHLQDDEVCLGITPSVGSLYMPDSRGRRPSPPLAKRKD